ncbi:hypothetical protein QOT17_004450 [Balamuthia mandrillaris]
MQLTVLLLVIMGTAGGLSALCHTAYFLYKLYTAGRRQSSYYYNLDNRLEAHEEYGNNASCDGVIELDSMEVSCCMGWLWNSCTENGAMKKRTFIVWYLVALGVDCVLTATLCLVVLFLLPRGITV